MNPEILTVYAEYKIVDPGVPLEKVAGAVRLGYPVYPTPPGYLNPDPTFQPGPP
jgi:hypothetical protein